MIRGIASSARPACYLNRLSRAGRAILLLASIRCLWAQSPPISPRGPWYSSEEQRIVTEARRFQSPRVRIDPERVYSLSELIDLAEANNPETRIAWEGAVAQAGALGVARSELFPVVAAAATAGVDRYEANLGARFYRENGSILPDRAGTELHPVRLRCPSRKDRRRKRPPSRVRF